MLSSLRGAAPMWKLAAGAALSGGAAFGVVASADTVVEISSGDTTVKITMDGSSAAAAEPADPNYPPLGISPTLDEFPDWIKLGCGDKPFNCPKALLPENWQHLVPPWGSTFCTDGKTPDKMPDMSKHFSHMADVLNAHPEIYEKLKNKTTKNGVSLGDVIKTGVDNLGHPHVKLVGMTAGDEESYETFKELFDPVISRRHGGYAPDAIQPTNIDLTQLSDTDIDPECKYVLTTRVRTGRSVRGFRLPPVISFEERRELEALCTKALLNMKGDLKGDYFPLHGSRSYAAKPEGMSHAKENELRSCGNLFQEPDSTLLLASGMARHWPDGRGVFHNNDSNLFVWFGEEDHLRIVSMQGDLTKPTFKGKQIKEVTARFIRACNEVESVLKENGSEFMHNPHLGWVLTCPSNLGTGLRAGTMVRLPQVSGKHDFKKLCNTMRLQARGKGGVDSTAKGGVYDVSNLDRIGKGEVDLVNILIEGAAQLVKWETMYDTGNGRQADREINRQMGR